MIDRVKEWIDISARQRSAEHWMDSEVLQAHHTIFTRS